MILGSLQRYVRIRRSIKGRNLNMKIVKFLLGLFFKKKSPVVVPSSLDELSVNNVLLSKGMKVIAKSKDHSNFFIGVIKEFRLAISGNYLPIIIDDNNIEWQDDFLLLEYNNSVVSDLCTLNPNEQINYLIRKINNE